MNADALKMDIRLLADERWLSEDGDPDGGRPAHSAGDSSGHKSVI